MSKKSEHGNRIYRIRGAVTRRKLRQLHPKSGPGSKPGFTERTYCPDCTEEQQKDASNGRFRAHPQYAVHAAVSGQQKRAVCKNLHSWPVV